MKITMDEQQAIRPEGALKKRQMVDRHGKNKGDPIDVCSECRKPVEIKIVVGVLHLCGADALD
jgi:hypothetical protein